MGSDKTWSKKKVFWLSFVSLIIGAAIAGVVVYVYMSNRSKSAPVSPYTPPPLMTHVLDNQRGGSAANVTTELYILAEPFLQYNTTLPWKRIASRRTDSNGRIRDFIERKDFKKGIYKLNFKTKEYASSLGLETFYPYVETVFRVDDASSNYHVPILLNPYGYSTYRGG